MENAIQPIRTDADHAAALVRVDELMEAEPGTADGDYLEVLVTLIEAYEARRSPIVEANPIDSTRARTSTAGNPPHDFSR